MAANCCHTNLASPTHPFSSTSSWRPSFCPSVPRLPKPRLPLVASTAGAAVFLPQLCPISTAKKSPRPQKNTSGNTPQDYLEGRSRSSGCWIDPSTLALSALGQSLPGPDMLPQRHPTFNNPVSQIIERHQRPDNQTSTTSFPLVVLSATSRKPPRKPGPAAVPPPSQEAPPTTTHEPGRTSCPSQKLVLTRKRGCKQNSKRSLNDVRRLCERWLEGARGVPLAETAHCSHT